MGTLALITGFTAVVAVWGAMIVVGTVRRARSTARHDHPEPGRRLAQAIVVLAWAYGTFPSLLGVIANGRSVTSTVSESVPPSSLGSRLGTACSVLIFAAVIGLIIVGGRQRAEREYGRLAAYLLPAIAADLIDVGHGMVFARQELLYPLIGLAFWLVRPKLSWFRPLGTLTVVTAALSIAMALAMPALAFYANPGGAATVDKAILGGRLLAGPLQHPNLLGSVLAFGAPSILLLRTRRWRAIGAVMVAIALLWCSSRTSIVAAAAAFLVYLLGSDRPARTTLRAGLAWVSLATAAFLIIWTPLHVSDPLAYSERGQIWIASLNYWDAGRLFGLGSDFYNRIGQFANNLGPYAFTGHNLMVDTLVKIGIVGLLVYAIWLYLMMRSAVQLARISFFGVAWVISFAFQGWLEARIDFINLGQTGWVLWLPIAIIFCVNSEPLSPEAAIPASAQRELVAVH